MLHCSPCPSPLPLPDLNALAFSLSLFLSFSLSLSLSDDDNVYDDRLFEEIFRVRNIGVWPVGFSGQRRAEFAYIDALGRVTGFNSYLFHIRRFPIDMAGFGINIKYFLRSAPLFFDVNAPPVFGETMLLEATGEVLRRVEETVRLLCRWPYGSVVCLVL